MSTDSRDEISVVVILLAFVLMVLLAGSVVLVVRESDNRLVEKRISFGEKSLLSKTKEPHPLKKTGIDAIKDKDFSVARDKLYEYISQKSNRNDPEALIFLNNARIDSKKAKSYTIAVSVPINQNPEGSLEILRGVAQAQNEINSSEKEIKEGWLLKVAIASDDNDPKVAQQIATALVNKREVLGVVGHYASDVTLAAAPVYISRKLVAITPISTYVEFSNLFNKSKKRSPYVFRTVPSDKEAARSLANYMLKNWQMKKAAIFYNSQNNYSKSLKKEFKEAVLQAGGQVSNENEFDLSDRSLDVASSVKQAIGQDVKVLMLAADTDTLGTALHVVNINDKRLKLLGGDAVYSPKTLKLGKDEAVGMVVAIPWHIDSAPDSDFARKSRELWGGEVNWRTALAYDATRALVAAIERNPTRSGVQQALSSPDFSITVASGKVEFLPSGDRKNPPVQLVEIVPDTTSATGYKFVPVRP